MLVAYRVARPVISDRLAATDDGDNDEDEGNENCTPRGMELAKFAGRQPPSLSKWTIAIGALLLMQLVGVAITTDDQRRDDQDGMRDQLHPPLYVDTKYWTRNMEFGERDNWRDRLRPCTLLEKIAIEDAGAVISLGDAIDNSFGALESSSVRELILANNGILLLEEDTLKSEQDYIAFLNASGDCFDSSTLPEHLQDQHWFRFEPSSDELSWFNPANWISGLSQEIVELVPDSHQVPCNEDVVVFGSRRAAAWNLVEANERSSVITFKVNFRPSEQMLARRLANGQTLSIVDTLRVSKLKIGDRSFMQGEFDQLVRLYGDSLFDFNDEKSIFNSIARSANQSDINLIGRPQSELTIDESSIQASEQEQDLCLDEAGCLCGNEQAKMMEIICSFNQPLELFDMPCFDPIRSQGYCNPICATSITINMTPAKFSERYVASMLNKILTGELSGIQLPSQDYFIDHVFIGSRRVDHTKYEITLRLAPATADIYQEILGRDIELAQLIKQQLEKAAIKSFYGIKTINLKSSVLWRRNNSITIFWLAFISALSLSTIMFVHYESYVKDLVMSRTDLAKFIDMFEIFNSEPNNEEVSYVNVDELPMSTHQQSIDSNDQLSSRLNSHESSLPGQEFAMIELDARSITDSTHGLLND